MFKVVSTSTSSVKKAKNDDSIDRDYTCDLLDLALLQERDHLIIKAQSIGKEKEYRRKRSLKFRAKMRDWREKVFNDAFHRKDRMKNLNKQIAARRRQRDGKGKFNLEEFEQMKEAQPE